VLTFELNGTARAIGITRRRRGSMSPAAALLADAIRSAVADSGGGAKHGPRVPARPAMAAVGE
jgi:hypothetical protein